MIVYHFMNLSIYLINVLDYRKCNLNNILNLKLRQSAIWFTHHAIGLKKGTYSIYFKF